MVSYQYSYLIADLVLIIVWIILYLRRRDIRKEMLIISLIFGIVGLFVQPIYITDWWHPLTLTNTLVGIEDFLFGFGIGGIAAVIYEVVFQKRIREKKNIKKLFRSKKDLLITPLLLLLILFLGSFFIFKINSFYSSIIAFTIPIIYIWLKRKDLIINSIFSGFLLTIIGLFWFIVPEIITPGWVRSHWFLENLSGIMLFNIPIEDLIWGFFAGAFIGPLYEYWKEGKLINIKN